MTNTFFIITPLKLEKLALEELKNKWGLIDSDHHLPEVKILPGGLELTTTWQNGFKLNHWLKIPVRILLRLGQFKGRDFPTLYNKVLQLPWHEYLLPGEVNFKVTSHESKLMHTGRVEETCREAIKEYWINQPAGKKEQELSQHHENPKIFIRIDQDTVEVSLDTSGKALYQRSHKEEGARAPLRENLANACLAFTEQTLGKKISEHKIWLDPFCGSGTLLTEAQNFDQPSMRPFAYEQFKIFRNQSFKKIKAQELTTTQNFIGLEIEEQQHQRNLTLANESLHFFNENCLSPKTDHGKVDFMITNPPYGDRVRIGGALGVLDALKKLVNLYHPKYVGIIFPKGRLENLPEKTFRLEAEMEFLHGGKSLYYYLYSIRSH